MMHINLRMESDLQDFGISDAPCQPSPRLAQIAVWGSILALAAPGVDFAFWDASGQHGPRLAQIDIWRVILVLAAPG